MFGIWKRRKPIVYEHWFVALDGFRSSVSEFYREVEEELGRRELPDVGIARIRLAEGPLGGGAREYLRMERERVVLDVCASPFGTGWFFSCRIAMIPFRLRLWELLILAGLFILLVFPFMAVFGLVWGLAAFAASGVALLTLANVFVATRHRSLDAVVLRIPCLGALYELFLRRQNTYYQDDARLIFATVVGRVVEEKVREFASAGGIEDVDFREVIEPVSPETWIQQVRGAFVPAVGRAAPAAAR